MKRILILGLSGMLALSMSAVAFADDSEDEETSSDVPSNAQLRKAALIADYYAGEEGDSEAALTEILDLRSGESGEMSVGWGALFKLTQLAKAKGMTLAELLAIADGEDGWAFGKQFKSLTEPQSDRLDGDAKNVGQLKKQNREKPEKAKGPKKDD